MRFEYSPGTWYVIAGAEAFAVVERAIEADAVAAIWRVLAAGGGLGEVLQVLTQSLGNSLTSLPTFCVATFAGDDVHAAVRGAIVLDADGTKTTGTGAITWREIDLVAPDLITVECPGHASGPALPLASGVALGSMVRAHARQPRGVDGRLQPTAPIAGLLPHPATGPAEPALTADASRLTWSLSRLEQEPPQPAALSASPETDVIEPPPPAEPAAPQGLGQAAEKYRHLFETTSAPGRPTREADEPDDEAMTLMSARKRSHQDEPEADDDLIAAMPGAPRRAHAGTVRVSTGEQVVLDRPVVVGRRPAPSRQDDTDVHLVAVPSPGQDISRSHLELRSEGSQAIAIDLNSTNGTVLHREGQEPRRLQPLEEVLVLDGDVFDLGDGVAVTYEEAT